MSLTVDKESRGDTAGRPPTSRAVHALHEVTTRPLIAIAVGVIVVASWIAVFVTDFDQDVQLAFATFCSGVTVVMVFVLQHTQQRQQVALQVKLNEIVRALPRADDRLIAVEMSSDDELVGLEQSQLDQRAATRKDAP
jgi:low affinity Fe/Cu permease